MKRYFSDDKKIRLYNGDCLEVMKKIPDSIAECFMTSPPYNNSRQSTNLKNHEGRYDIYMDNMTNEDYIQWSLSLFEQFDRLLKDDGVVLYNINYGSENLDVLWLLLADILKKSNFMIADVIIWKKKNALPNNVSKNKMTRICEFVFVLCRKSELHSFMCNKEVSSVSARGQKFYKSQYNFVEAKNNDGSNDLNKATYSTDLCLDLIGRYVDKGLVIDPFNGTGTTGVACKILGLDYVGIELSEKQFEYSIDRLNKTEVQK